MKKLFTEFQPVSKAEWLQKVEKDLKGKPLTDLQWHLGENITLEPFYHHTDIDKNITPLRDLAADNRWAIGEDIHVKVIKEANREVLTALECGVTAPRFVLEHLDTELGLNMLLNQIDLSIIEIHFEQTLPNENPKDLLQHYYDLVTKQGLDTTQLKGTLHCDPLMNPVEGGIDKLAALVQFANQFLPQWKVLSINRPSLSETPVESLVSILKRACDYLDALMEKGLNLAEILPHLQFSIEVGRSYFVEIAKIRALKILWANILKAYGSDTYPIHIDAHLSQTAYDDEQYTNMIRATTQAMSAVIGGIDRLTVLPADALQGTPNDFPRRIARNVQHILELESHLGRVQDPAAGSYYIEQLTDKLVEEVWKKMK